MSKNEVNPELAEQIAEDIAEMDAGKPESTKADVVQGSEQVECPNCKGTGLLDAFTPCENCQRTGYMLK